MAERTSVCLSDVPEDVGETVKVCAGCDDFGSNELAKVSTRPSRTARTIGTPRPVGIIDGVLRVRRAIADRGDEYG